MGHPGAVDDRFLPCFIFQLFQGKGITDDVLREALHALLIVRFASHLVMNVATQNIGISTFTKSQISKVLKLGNMLPGQYHFDEGIINQPFFL